MNLINEPLTVFISENPLYDKAEKQYLTFYECISLADDLGYKIYHYKSSWDMISIKQIDDQLQHYADLRELGKSFTLLLAPRGNEVYLNYSNS